ncbi:fungal-specific transcription factor domain-containing protein [Thermoascus aurantiacus ATCC 26904]
MTVTSLVMPNRRGEASGKQPLRLPIIAPKDDVSSSTSSSVSANVNAPNLTIPARVRLPPRSRTGCWTCRSRKVKCDEERPTCGQCARLGHICDYRPRLSFRDDTPRIMERMSEVSTAGNVVWDPTSPTLTENSCSPSAVGDSLPPFASLTSDEERERKAEAYSPGTYHVIVNPDSFSGLPEYADDSVEGPSIRDRTGSVANSMVSGSRGEERENSIETDDPNVVILAKFEDSTRRPSSNWRASRPSPRLGATGSSSPAIRPQFPPHDRVQEDSSRSLDQVITRGGQDARLLSHFRDVVWKQLVQVESPPESASTSHFNSPGVEIFEREAATFRPLFHAMMAVSALSLAHQDGGQNIDALQHYQQAFPSLQTCLRSNQDLSSDGLFLTHFLLLVYEIAAAEPGGSNLWSHHISRLLHISLMRLSMFGSERYPFIIWWVCHIDLDALFSGAGTGEFVGAMLKNNMLPGPGFILYPLGPGGYSAIYPEESDSLPLILQLHHDTFVLAARLGFLAAELRRESISPPFLNGSISTGSFTHPAERQKKLFGIREAFKLLWESPNATLLRQHLDSFPRRSRELLQQSLTLFHACLIFSYTSMWPGQRLESGDAPDEDIGHHASVILQVAESIVHAGRFDLRFVVFPLFMAGVATSSGGQKMMAMELMASMEKEGVGRNATTTRQVLQLVYERQTQQLMSVGHSLAVDWIDVMIEHGLQVVNFGL